MISQFHQLLLFASHTHSSSAVMNWTDFAASQSIHAVCAKCNFVWTGCLSCSLNECAVLQDVTSYLLSLIMDTVGGGGSHASSFVSRNGECLRHLSTLLVLHGYRSKSLVFWMRARSIHYSADILHISKVHTHTQSCTHTRMHACMLTHKHTHTHTHIHTTLKKKVYFIQ